MFPSSGNFKLSDSFVLLSRDLALTSRLLAAGLLADVFPLEATVNGLEALVEAADFVPEELDGFELTLAATFLVAGVVAGLGLIPLEFFVFSVATDVVLAPASLPFDRVDDEVESPADLTLDLVDNLGDMEEGLEKSLPLAGAAVELGSAFLELFGIVFTRLLPEEILHPSSLT